MREGREMERGKRREREREGRGEEDSERADGGRGRKRKERTIFSHLAFPLRTVNKTAIIIIVLSQFTM